MVGKGPGIPPEQFTFALLLSHFRFFIACACKTLYVGLTLSPLFGI
jgi:hypothetical protein